MSELQDVSTDALRDLLAEVHGAKPAKRLMIALAYSDGVPVDRLASRYGIPASTIYYWLDRFEAASLEEAAEDDTRPGRPPKLTAAQRDTVERWVSTTPRTQGIDADEWTSTLLRDRILEEFGVEYSPGHVSRLLREWPSDDRE